MDKGSGVWHTKPQSDFIIEVNPRRIPCRVLGWRYLAVCKAITRFRTEDELQALALRSRYSNVEE